MSRPRLYLDALVHARARQLRARALAPVNRRRLGRCTGGMLRPLPDVESLWRGDAFAAADRAAARLSGSEVDVLGKRIPYPPADWQPPELERLRRFHLNYGDEVLGAARGGEGEVARAGMEAWIAANPPVSRCTGDGWHPYVLSTRVGNWIAAISLEPLLASASADESLRLQLAYLERNVEHGVLGNHLIRNARALALGGGAFGDRRLVDRALALLRRELPEQVLADGGHYERSPAYHLIVLRDLLEIRAATGCDEFDRTIERMRHFAAAIARPDGAPPLFNDGGLDIAPDLRAVLPTVADGLIVFPDSGYVIVRGHDRWLAFDCGPLSPRFLPAHAHADALSFQLWRGGRPLVVDPGTYAYEGPERDWFRSTPAHATVSVDGASQCSFWATFRAGMLPHVELVDAAGDAGNGHVLASVTGFPDVDGGITHRRRIAWSSDASLRVEDEVHGSGRHRLASTLPLAPGVTADTARAVCAGASVTAIRRPVSERFYERADAGALVAETETTLPHELGWTLEGESR